MNKEIGVGLLGLGTVGSGVVSTLEKNRALIADRSGVDLSVRRIAVRDLQKSRSVVVDPALLTKDIAAVVNDDRVDIVVETMGGIDVAKSAILSALAAGKAVVTANKALLAEHGEEVFDAAAAHNVDLYYGAAVAGGIPIVRGLREGLIANRIHSIYGILNGTCNYILTRMERDGEPFDQVLAEAQAAGYAEADPALDIDGVDAAHKAAILASTSYGFHIPMDAVHVEGIRGISVTDLQNAVELGYRVKLLAIVKDHDGAVSVNVYPVLIPLDAPLAGVGDVFNAVQVDGDIVGETLFYGRGAGSEPTASAVISDLIDVARTIKLEAPPRLSAFAAHDHYGRLQEPGEVETRYYIRLLVRDRPGVVAQIGELLARHDVSIASLLQKECGGNGAPVTVVIATRTARERQFRAVFDEIDQLSCVAGPSVRFRIEDFS